MTEFSTFYKDGIDHLYVPGYSMEELRSLKRHKKYVKERKRERFAAAVFFVFLFSIVASATAYAAYAIHKNIQFTSYGIKIDFSDPKLQSDQIVHNYTTNADTVVSYEDAYGVPAFNQEDFTDEYTVQNYDFDNWEDALDVIGFPIVYPENIQYSALNISFCQTSAFQEAMAVYTAPGRKVIEMRYTYYLIQNWSFAKDYNAQIIDKHVYTNKYGYDFWIMECQYDDQLKKTNAMVYINDYIIELSFWRCETDEIYEVLDEFDLSVYE